MPGLEDINWDEPVKSNSNNKGNNTNNNSINMTSNSNALIDNLNIDGLDEYKAKDKIDYMIRKWWDNRSIYLLLGTLHEVWSREPSFKDISIKTMMEDPAELNKVKRKVLKVFHPDKIKTLEFKEKYCAESLYNVINKVYSEHV